MQFSHRRSVIRRVLLGGIALAAFLPIGGALASDWQPGLSLQLSGLPERREATATSDTLGTQNSEEVGFPFSVGGSLEVASPPLVSDTLPVRLFVHAGGSLVVDPEDPVVSTGDPGSPPFLSPILPAPESIENVGQTVRAQAKPWMLTGGIGAVLEIPAFDRTLYLRPSVEWMYRRDTMRTILGGGENEDPNPPPPNFLCNPCRTVFLDTQREKGYHSAGLGLAAELDGPQQGDFEMRFFAHFAAFHILGDRTADLSSTAAWARTDSQPTSRAPTTLDATYEREAWHYRFGVGARIVWHPR